MVCKNIVENVRNGNNEQVNEGGRDAGRWRVGGGIAKLNREVGEGLIEKVTFEERPEGSEEGKAMKISGEESFRQREKPVQRPRGWRGPRMENQGGLCGGFE